jgi:hypothetical protein
MVEIGYNLWPYISVLGRVGQGRTGQEEICATATFTTPETALQFVIWVTQVLHLNVPKVE